MLKKATKKGTLVQLVKKSKPIKRTKSISFKSSPWYASAAQSIGVSTSAR